MFGIIEASYARAPPDSLTLEPPASAGSVTGSPPPFVYSTSNSSTHVSSPRLVLPGVPGLAIPAMAGTAADTSSLAASRTSSPPASVSPGSVYVPSSLPPSLSSPSHRVSSPLSPQSPLSPRSPLSGGCGWDEAADWRGVETGAKALEALALGCGSVGKEGKRQRV